MEAATHISHGLHRNTLVALLAVLFLCVLVRSHDVVFSLMADDENCGKAFSDARRPHVGNYRTHQPHLSFKETSIGVREGQAAG